MNKKLLLAITGVLLVLVLGIVVYTKFFSTSEKYTVPSSSSSSQTSQTSQTSKASQSSKDEVKASSTEEVKTQESSTSVANETGKPSDQAEGREQTKAKTTSFDFNAMTQGDYSSVKGTWQNAGGETITFDENGLVSDTNYITSLHYDADGNLLASVQAGYTGYAIWFILSGNTASETDNSDKSRDRIFAGQSLTEDMAGAAYYRVSQ